MKKAMRSILSLLGLVTVSMNSYGNINNFTNNTGHSVYVVGSSLAYGAGLNGEVSDGHKVELNEQKTCSFSLSVDCAMPRIDIYEDKAHTIPIGTLQNDAENAYDCTATIHGNYTIQHNHDSAYIPRETGTWPFTDMSRSDCEFGSLKAL